jgi:GT2 family glycosyltransferase
VDILVGAFMWMSRKLYLEVGGFDEDCFMYSDDIDLSYMVLK